MKKVPEEDMIFIINPTMQDKLLSRVRELIEGEL